MPLLALALNRPTMPWVGQSLAVPMDRVIRSAPLTVRFHNTYNEAAYPCAVKISDERCQMLPTSAKKRPDLRIQVTELDWP